MSRQYRLHTGNLRYHVRINLQTKLVLNGEIFACYCFLEDNFSSLLVHFDRFHFFPFYYILRFFLHFLPTTNVLLRYIRTIPNYVIYIKNDRCQQPIFLS